MASKSVNITLPNISNLGLQIKLDGKWQKLDLLASRLQPSIQEGYDRAIKLYSNRLIRIVKKALTTGIPPSNSNTQWAPHSKSTIKRYGAHNLLNLTGTYSRAIGLKQYKSRTLIGLPIQSRHSSQGHITLNQLAILLEYGSKEQGAKGSIPARPVWRPALKSVGGKQALKTEIIREIRSKLLSNTGIRPNQVRL